jgi:hypothetical protein
MAILFPAVGDGLSRDGTFFDPAQDGTKCGWFKIPPVLIPGTPPIYHQLRNIGESEFFSGPFLQLSTSVSDPPGLDPVGVYAAADPDGATEADTDEYAQALSTWFHAAVRYKASTTELSLVINGVQIGAAVVIDLSAMAPQVSEVAFTAEAFDGARAPIAGAYLRDWQAWLSDAELALEMASEAAVRTADLLADTPLLDATDLTDESGNGHDWTLLGSAETVDGPARTSLAALVRLGQLNDASFTIRCWDAANNLIGDISADQPSIVNEYDSTDGCGLALAPDDDRLYATGAHYDDDATPHWLQVFRLSDGVLVTRTNLTAIDATIQFSYAAVVPSPGRVWVSVQRVADGQIWEFDTAGVFQGIVDTIPITDENPIELRTFDVLGNIVYYAIAQTVTGFGIARWNIPTHAALTPLVPAASQFQVIALTRTAVGTMAAIGVEKTPGPTHNQYFVRTYALDGTLLSDGGPADHTDQLTGCAAAPDGSAWTSDQSAFPNILSKVDTATGAVTATIDDDSNLSSANIMGLAGPFIPAVAALAVDCPIGTGVVGTPYASAVTGSGGTPPYTYGISAGALPDGLVLNAATGSIVGTPTVAGTFNFTIQVTGS